MIILVRKYVFIECRIIMLWFVYEEVNRNVIFLFVCVD